LTFKIKFFIKGSNLKKTPPFTKIDPLSSWGANRKFPKGNKHGPLKRTVFIKNSKFLAGKKSKCFYKNSAQLALSPYGKNILCGR
jgi:hypothetical protein